MNRSKKRDRMVNARAQGIILICIFGFGLILVLRDGSYNIGIALIWFAILFYYIYVREYNHMEEYNE